MLKELHIENFAIIQELELGFDNGLMIFTGETGAGKSIILDAISALVGGKVDQTMVRSGADRAVVEGVFTIPERSTTEVIAILQREDLLEDEQELTLGREIRAEGRSVGRVNGRSVSASLLKELGEYLVDIHGQSEHLSLLNVRSHLGLLDRFADCGPEMENYRQAYHELQVVRKELLELRELEQEAEKRTELLTFQAQEIEAARLEPGEEDELEHERSRLANAETLSNSAQEALALLDEGSPESQSATDLVGQASKLVETLARLDGEQTGLAEQLEGLAAGLGEVSRDLRGYLDGIEFNPKRLEQVETRLELIHQMKRKYGGSIEAVLEYGRKAREQLEKVQHASEQIDQLVEQEKDLIITLVQRGQELSRLRKDASIKLGQAVERELTDLSLSGAQFEAAFNPIPVKTGSGDPVGFNENGLDQMEFLIAPNPGEGLKPLVKIASGGETSRLMLALKNVLAAADFIPTLIFDEIDQGIGGRVGSVVGEKLWKLGREHQVMCVTHLTQLAAYGDRHYRVRKQVVEDRTLTQVKSLDDQERVAELALMNGSTSETNINSAFETLSRARERQRELI